MQKDKVALPPIETIKSSRINNFEDYAKWEKLKKLAYRNELRQEILQHDLNRESTFRQKERDRDEVNQIVRNQRKRIETDRNIKMKTEQKYMLDNWSMLQETPKVNLQKRANNPQEEYKEHPFVRLLEQQDKRKEQTKNNFIYQNKLNTIQSEMKRDQSIRKKMLQSEQRRRFDEHIEEQYRRKKRDRQFFENKYFKVDKSSGQSCKKEYLQYLKAQVNVNRSNPRHPRQGNYLHQVNRASPGNIGLSPAAHDRIKQMKTIQRSLKMFPQARESQKHSSHLQHSSGREIAERAKSRRTPYEKVVTERAPLENNSYHMQTIEDQPAYPMQSQFSQRLQRPSRPKKEYKQYNIINGSNRIFLS